MLNLNKVILFLFSFLCIALHAQDNEVIQILKNPKLAEFPVNQRLFLHINKTKYKDTDTIWFKGYSIQGPLQQASDISQTMIVALLNGNNEVVKSDQFLIFDGTAEGQIPLSNKMELGMYEVVAYGSNMLNQDLHTFFRSPIEIVATKPDKYNYSFGFNELYYQPGEKVEMQVLAHDKYYAPLVSENLVYEIRNGDEKLKGGRLKTNTEGIAFLDFPFEHVDPENSVLKINISNENFNNPFSADAYARSVRKALDVQLLPEGGDLVAGLMQVVAFRSVNDVGQPVEISGQVINAKGEIITAFKTTHQGMGKFMMIPHKEDEYKLQIKSPLEYAREIDFPEVLEKGFALSYLGTRGGKVIFKIAKNFEGLEKVTAVWQMDGLVIGTQILELENEKMFFFSEKGMPNGIAKLTLFDKGGEPFAERLVYVRSKADPEVNLSLNQVSHFPRGKGVVDLEIVSEGGLPVESNLSVSVTHIGEGINPLIPIPDIRDYTLFKSELSSPVYQPEQYFNKKPDDKMNGYLLDLVMMTHGWRKFNWYYELCHKVEPDFKYYNYDLYRGVVTKGKSVVPNARVEVYSWGKGIETAVSKADENGKFWVKPEFSEKSSPTIIISTERKNEFSRARLTITDREMEMRDSVVKVFYDELLPYVYNQHIDVYEKPGDIDTLFKIWDTKYLAELIVYGSQKVSRVKESLERFSTGTTYSLTEEDFGRRINDMESLIQQLGGGLYVEDDQVVRMSRGLLVPIPIMVDGRQIRDATFSDISYLSSDMIEGIAFVKSNLVSFELDSGGSDGALMIWTLPQKNVAVADKEKKNKHTSKRYSRVRTFYSPKYTTPKERSNPEADRRITTLWDNTVKTDSLGKAQVQFYNGDLKGTYLINIQGISKKNGPIFKEATFIVR